MPTQDVDEMLREDAQERIQWEMEQEMIWSIVDAATTQLDRTEGIFLRIPYVIYEEDKSTSLKDAARVHYRFQSAFLNWYSTTKKRDSNESGWENQLGSLRALNDGVDNGDLSIETFAELDVLSILFGKLRYLLVHTDAVGHFVRSGSLLELIEHIQRWDSSGNIPNRWIIDSVNKLCAHEKALCEQAEAEGTKGYEGLLGSPMEIRASLAVVFEYDATIGGT